MSTASTAAAVSTPAAVHAPARAALLLGALGVVYGDIGTSPIYALRESLRAAGDAAPATVLGTVSLVFWAVVLVVALKYVALVLRAVVILIALFAIQSRGSGRVGRWFGPVTAAWFAMLALAGIAHTAMRPDVLAALDPSHALALLGRGEGGSALLVVGSVFLALTGAEALYADMGHFGRSAIRIDWFALVMPALLLNYFGQGALVLADPAAAADPFFLLFPGPLLWLAVALATAATVIASQAVISGAFTLVQQAVQFGLLPRIEVRQTSEHEAGQIYVPQINWLLAAAVVALVLGFGSSESLAAAYGISVAGTMVATTLLVGAVARNRWRWGWPAVAAVVGGFGLLDLAFFAANVHKILDGGWFPLLVAAAAMATVLVWRRGRATLLARREEGAQPLDGFIASLGGPEAPHRARGTAVYLTARRDVVPAALALNLRHNGVLHERVALLTVETDRRPRVPEAGRLEAAALPAGFRLLTLRFGFAEAPDVPAALEAHAEVAGFEPGTASYFLGREDPVPSMRPELPPWQEKVFAFLTRNAVGATDYFRIPAQRAVELGTRVEL